MAIGPIDTESWHYRQFMDAIRVPAAPLTPWMQVRTKAEVRAAVERDVSKLRSVSEVGRKWIVGERMKWMGYSDDGKFYFKQRHPDMYFQPARQQGKTAAMLDWTETREIRAIAES
jgi:hypothetical protein